MSGGFRGNRPRMGGPRRSDVAAPRPQAQGSQPPVQRNRKRVLFVCIGNSCRSQMAEGFARAYGGDIMVAQSAGLSPAPIVQPETRKVMAERNVRIDEQFPKGMEILAREQFDVIVNMSGQNLPLAPGPPGAKVREWVVKDPMGQGDAVYKTVVEQVEALVMRLILEMRSSTL